MEKHIKTTCEENQVIFDHVQKILIRCNNQHREKYAFSLKKALANIRRHPTPILTLNDAKSLPGVGDKIGNEIMRVLDKENQLKVVDSDFDDQFTLSQSSVVSVASLVSQTSQSIKRNRANSITSTASDIITFKDDNIDLEPSLKKLNRAYYPEIGKGPWILMICLAINKGIASKSELESSASSIGCDCEFSNVWTNSLKTLKKRDVITYDNGVLSFTQQGKRVGDTLLANFNSVALKKDELKKNDPMLVSVSRSTASAAVDYQSDEDDEEQVAVSDGARKVNVDMSSVKPHESFVSSTTLSLRERLQSKYAVNDRNRIDSSDSANCAATEQISKEKIQSYNGMAASDNSQTSKLVNSLNESMSQESVDNSRVKSADDQNRILNKVTDDGINFDLYFNNNYNGSCPKSNNIEFSPSHEICLENEHFDDSSDNTCIDLTQDEHSDDDIVGDSADVYRSGIPELNSNSSHNDVDVHSCGVIAIDESYTECEISTHHNNIRQSASLSRLHNHNGENFINCVAAERSDVINLLNDDSDDDDDTIIISSQHSANSISSSTRDVIFNKCSSQGLATTDSLIGRSITATTVSNIPSINHLATNSKSIATSIQRAKSLQQITSTSNTTSSTQIAVSQSIKVCTDSASIHSLSNTAGGNKGDGNLLVGGALKSQEEINAGLTLLEYGRNRARVLGSNNCISSAGNSTNIDPRPLNSMVQTSHEGLDTNCIYVVDPKDWEIVLLVDMRERDRALIVTKLMDAGICCDSCTLAVGDFLWIAKPITVSQSQSATLKRTSSKSSVSVIQGAIVLDSIAERKTFNDLSSSIIDGRYSEQKLRLKDCRIRNTMYIVEGMSTSSSGVATSSKVAAIRTAINSIQIESDLEIVRTRGLDHTIDFLKAIHRFQAQINSSNIADNISTASHSDNQFKQSYQLFDYFQQQYVKKQVTTLGQLFGNQLRQIPGCSSVVVEVLVDKYQTFANMIRSLKQLSPECAQAELSELKKTGMSKRFGPKLAETLWKVFGEYY